MEDGTMATSSARVILWCAPRCTSNLFAKCLTGVQGNEVWIEPYQHAHFALTEIKRQEPPAENSPLPYTYQGNERLFKMAAEGMSAFFGSEILPHRLPYDTVKTSLETSPSKRVFVKDMGIAMESETLRQFLPMGFKHTFLIRHPLLAYRSYRKALYLQFSHIARLQGQEPEDESDFDLNSNQTGPKAAEFFLQNHALWRYVRENLDPEPIVVDSSDLLRDPARCVSKYCRAVGLPFSDALLSWEATPESYRSWRLSGDNVLDHAENFLGALMKTTGFLPPSEIPSRDELTCDVLRVADDVMSCYEEMYATRI